MTQTNPEDEYYLDDLGRICPVHQMGWVREGWQDSASFDDAMERITAVAMADVFPEGDRMLGAELSDLQAKQYLDVADGFYLATAINGSLGVSRFIWQGKIFFTMRPDFFIRLLVSDLCESPINALESAIRDRLSDNYRELDALKSAFTKGEIEIAGTYPMEWWIEFWKKRGISAITSFKKAGKRALDPDRPLLAKERNTYIIIIAALCENSSIKPENSGTASKISAMTELIGATVSDETVRDILNLIPDTLERRMK